MTKRKEGGHLVLEDRMIIEEAIGCARSATEVARTLGVSPSTVIREVRQNRSSRFYVSTPAKRAADICARYDVCGRTADVCGPCTERHAPWRCRSCPSTRCHMHCPDLLMGPRCERILSWPYVCDGCTRFASCGKPKITYAAHRAQSLADSRKSFPRKGICCTMAQISEMDALVTPLIRKGQSPAAIWAEHADELPVSPRTYYRYLERDLTEVIAIELSRKVRRKPKRVRDARTRDRVDRAGRTYGDFLALPEEERLSAWQGDTVEGHETNRRRILSMDLPRIRFQLYLLLEDGTSGRVVAALDAIERLIGSPEDFERAIPILLVDRGREFDDWAGMERSCLAEGVRRCRIFYTDPERADQKGACERNHSELRRILPKGRTDFDALTPRDAALAGSHVNSYPRPSLGGARPIDLAALMLPEALTVGIGMFRVPADEVTMRPELVPHAMER